MILKVGADGARLKGKKYHSYAYFINLIVSNDMNNDLTIFITHLHILKTPKIKAGTLFGIKQSTEILTHEKKIEHE